MMFIRPVERDDLAQLMHLAGKTGGGLTSLPADADTLQARIERSLLTWQGGLPQAEQGYVFVLADSENNQAVGISAIEVAVGLQDPWYNFRVGNQVHASRALNIYNVMPTLTLSNDHTGSSELCTLFLDPDYRRDKNGYLLSKSRFLFMAGSRDKFTTRIVAEMRGVIEGDGYSPFWHSVGQRFFSMAFSEADYLCGTGQKAFIAELMPKHPLYIDYLDADAQRVIGKVHPHTAPARAVLESEGLHYQHYIDIFDGGPTLECNIDDVRAIRESQRRPLRIQAPQPQNSSLTPCLVSNERFDDFRTLLVAADPRAPEVMLTAEQADILRSSPGDMLRIVTLNPEEKSV